MKNQREATVDAIMHTLSERGFEYELNGKTPISEVLTDSDKATVRDILFEQFRSGDVSYKAEFQSKVGDDSELKKYISGLTNNWIRKYKPFNSGVAYIAKNPGSRAGSSDEQMRELKKLLSQVKSTGNTDAISEVEAAITARAAEIKPTATAKPINVDALPEALRHLVQS